MTLHDWFVSLLYPGQWVVFFILAGILSMVYFIVRDKNPDAWVSVFFPFVVFALVWCLLNVVDWLILLWNWRPAP